MALEQKKSNKLKAKGGNKYERELYDKIRLNEKLKVKAVRRQKKFYYNSKTPEDEIAEMLNGKFSERMLNKLVSEYMKNNEDKPIRTEKKNFKKSDITCRTEYKYLVGGKLKELRIIIDTTTSARGDRIKAKAQDASVYDNFGFPYLYIICLPNDKYFEDNDYEKPEREVKLCQNEIYSHNFGNLYKADKVSLILQEDDLIDFIEYIGKRKEKDIEKLIENWKRKRYPIMYAKCLQDRKDEMDEMKAKIRSKLGVA